MMKIILKELGRRYSILASCVFFLLSLCLLSFFNWHRVLFILLGFDILSIFLAFRVFNFKHLIIAVLLPIFYTCASFFIFIEFPFLNLYFKLALCIAFTFFLYYLYLSVNTILVSAYENKSFPVLRAGKSTFFWLTVITAFLLFTVIYKQELNPFLNFVLFTGVSFLLSLLRLFSFEQ